MRFDIITIFPKIFDSYLNESILKRALERRIIDVHAHDIRDFAKNKHNKVDDTPYGGGAGMVLMAEPALRAVDAVRKKTGKIKKTKIIVLSAKGKQFNQKLAYDWAKKYKQIIFVSGRYEGIDERVKIALKAEEISIGPYVLTDGDVAAMAIISAVTRLLPGAIRLESLVEESHWNLILKKEKGATRPERGSPKAAGSGLEYPHYTRPETITYKGKKFRVPNVLLSGNHADIETWRRRT